MHSVEESLLQSRHSVGSETGTAPGRKRASTRDRQKEREKERERTMNTVECIHSKKACFRAAIHSEEKLALEKE
jgi:hypothetical protein